MAQAYFPSRTVKPALHESVFGGLHGDKQLSVEDVQEAYVESKDR
jgi:mitofusin